MSNLCTRTLRRAVLALAALPLLGAGDAVALSSFGLSLAATNWDQPTLTLTNTSDAGEWLTALTVSVGDTSFTFDYVVGTDPSEIATGASLLSPDRTNNNGWVPGGRSDLLSWSYTDFQPGEQHVFTVDVDHDLALLGSWFDTRFVFFNNDFPFADPNTVVSASFSDGSTASLTLPDAPLAASYVFASGPGTGGSGAAVAEPSVFALLGLGLVGLAWLGEPRRPAAP